MGITNGVLYLSEMRFLCGDLLIIKSLILSFVFLFFIWHLKVSVFIEVCERCYRRLFLFYCSPFYINSFMAVRLLSNSSFLCFVYFLFSVSFGNFLTSCFFQSFRFCCIWNPWELVSVRWSSDHGIISLGLYLHSR